jgi:hypothetical protein
MKLSRPRKATFWLSVGLVVLGLLGAFGGFRLTAPFAFWLVLLGYVLLALGNLTKSY